MIGGYYTAVSAMAAMMAEQQIIGNNLANLNTIGYKQDIPQETEFERILFNALVPRSALGKMSEATGPVGRIGTGVELLPTDLDLTTGPLIPTHALSTLLFPTANSSGCSTPPASPSTPEPAPFSATATAPS